MEAKHVSGHSYSLHNGKLNLCGTWRIGYVFVADWGCLK